MSPASERMTREVQRAIDLYDLLSKSDAFSEAKTEEQIRNAVRGWYLQTQFDEATGETYLPKDKFSNFAVELATLFKAKSQKELTNLFNRMYDLIQGSDQLDLFAENKKFSLEEAIKETLGIDYNGKKRGTTLDSDHPTGEGGEQGESGNSSGGEPSPQGEGTANGTGGAQGDAEATVTEPPHTRTATQEKKAKERRQSVESEVRKMTDALGTTVRILDSIDQVRDPKIRKAIEAGEKTGEKVTGWYDPVTGEVVVYYPNLIDANEAKLTYLHEVVGHKGLRALFGDKFEDTMKDVYRSLPKRLQDSVQKRMDDEDFKSKKYSDPLVASVEEELSNWAEKNKKPSWWDKVVANVRDKIRSVVDLEMTDADIDYLLWRSRHNLEKQTLQQRATDRVLEQRARKANEEARKNGQVLFREKDEELVERAKAIEGIKPTVVEKSPKDKTEAREIYSGIGKVRNKADGREVEFYKGILGKLPYERGLFFKSIPGLKDAFANSVLAYSDTDDRTGEKRPDGTVHKAHPNVKEYHNYVGKVQIDGKDYYVRFTVTEERGRDRNGLHSAFVSSIDLYEKGATPATMTNLQTLQGKHREGVADAKLREFFERARKAEEKVSGNGEKSSEAHFRTREKQQAHDRAQQISDEAEKRIYDEDRTLEQRRINSLAQELGMSGYELPENADLDNTEGMVVREAARQGTLKDSLGERWDEFLKKVYQNTDEETLKDINEFARVNGWNFAEATERYLASLSDNGAFEEAVERGMWDNIKSAFNGALEGKGFEFGAEDNDIRYALWRNEQNKTEGADDTLLARATEVVMRSQVGNDGNGNGGDIYSLTVLFRGGDNEMAREIGDSQIATVRCKCLLIPLRREALLPQSLN